MHDTLFHNCKVCLQIFWAFVIANTIFVLHNIDPSAILLRYIKISYDNSTYFSACILKKLWWSLILLKITKIKTIFIKICWDHTYFSACILINFWWFFDDFLILLKITKVKTMLFWKTTVGMHIRVE